MRIIETQKFYIYSSAYEFQVPMRRKSWEKLTWDEQMLYYSALSDLSVVGWTIVECNKGKRKVKAVVYQGKIIGFSYIVTTDDRKAFVIAILYPLSGLGVDERLEGDPS